MRLLVLDAPSSQRTPWISALKTDGFNFDRFNHLSDGKEAVAQMAYQMMLVDSRLPGGDAVGWLRDQRSVGVTTPFVLVTPAHDLEKRIRAFEYGADDCVIDTIDARELVAKVRAILRRAPMLKPGIVDAGNLRFDIEAREVSCASAMLALPRRELDILEHLMASFNRTVRRNFLETAAYGTFGEVCPNTIEVRMSRLRRALQQAGADVEIRTIRGVGYRLQPISSEQP
ncbi:chemotaxis protein CheY [Rhodomicrobium udaipurense JA643]|uniref:Response regulator transcription factor n=1 Tax=Rhodomicrobium udaipurense TaxID=1202716 RepID=A0A8I1GJ25_9HYPH|nr:response regulator transcription factor [Rhodomicrobium udaipurense]KAI95304.1 chemotaxis protein CheY [Rhodomicrobium udaipurense JA643]MBJ7544432.1 response regulator transcription factor [Rhodomicrobium udaipurense]